MKKLTAGIFATILGLTAMGAADAAVTSKAYVDAAVASAKSDVTALGERVTTAEGDIAGLKAADTTLQGNIDGVAGRVTTIENDYLTAADKTELQGAIDDKQDILDTTNLVRGDEIDAGTGQMKAAGNVISSITAENGTVTYTTASVATSEGLAELQQTVDGLEANSATKTELETAQNTLQGEIDAVEGRMDTAEGKITAIEGDYLKAADKTELQTQITANKTSIDNLDATYATEAEAKDFADAKDAAIAAADAKGAQGIADAATAQAAAEAAQTTANTAVSDAATAQAAAEAAQATADKAIQAPAACSDPTNMCVLVSDGTSVTWQVIANVYPDNNGTL